MRCNRDEGDFTCTWAVAPENPIAAQGTRRSILYVTLKDLGAGIVGVFDGIVFVRCEARVARVGLEEINVILSTFH